MGFGRKTDFTTGNTFDLDRTYKDIIRPAVHQAGFRCVRSDEPHERGHINRDTSALLLQADLVIADVSTYNPDTIYELGIRNALRPFSTIIIKEKGIGKMPFDLDNARMFTYSHISDETGVDELKRSVNGLSGLISKVTAYTSHDGLSEEYVHSGIPLLSSESYQNLLIELIGKENYIFEITDKAHTCMNEGDFEKACHYWSKAVEKVPYETYFVQQLALSKYKSKLPSYSHSLKEALQTIETLHPSNDPETLGITGAIYKNLYLLHGDTDCLEKAIEFYGKGFKLSKAYYNGENYALCLNMKAAGEKNENEKNYYKVEAKKTREKMIESLEEVVQLENFDQRMDKKWMFATLAHCYYSFKDETATFFERKFLELAVGWEKQAYALNKEENRKVIMNYEL